MPELPEVETVVRGLRPDLEGRTIMDFRSFWSPQIYDGTAPEAVAARLKGQRVERLWRRAKWIVADLTDDHLLVHLKMSGRLYIAAAARSDDEKYIRAEWYLDNEDRLYFSDMRKFGRILVTADLDTVFSKLGPEPLEDSFTLNVFQERLINRTGLIKPLLLNQTFIAGVGNIYADEALWLARIAPRRNANTLSDEETVRLHKSIRAVLRDGIKREGASINWYRKADGTTGRQQNHFAVYDQEEQPCPRCATPVKKIRLAQRGTHFCPNCQH